LLLIANIFLHALIYCVRENLCFAVIANIFSPVFDNGTHKNLCPMRIANICRMPLSLSPVKIFAGLVLQAF